MQNRKQPTAPTIGAGNGYISGPGDCASLIPTWGGAQNKACTYSDLGHLVGALSGGCPGTWPVTMNTWFYPTSGGSNTSSISAATDSPYCAWTYSGTCDLLSYPDAWPPTYSCGMG